MTATDSTRPPAAADPRPGPRARVGVFGIGLAAYWPQFQGLRERLTATSGESSARPRPGRGGGLGRPRRHGAGRARGGRALRARALDLVLCYTVTYATSRQVLPACSGQGARRPQLPARRRPRLRAYRHGRVAGQLHRLLRPRTGGRLRPRPHPFNVVAGTLDDDERAWATIGGLGQRGGRRAALRRARFGFLGHTYPGMLDMYSDFTAVHAQLGAHVEVLEIDDLGTRVDAADRRRASRPRRPRSAPCSTSRSRGATLSPARHGRGARLVGARRRWAGSAGVTTSRSTASTYYYRGLDGTRPSSWRRADRRQLAAHGARYPDGGRGRPQDLLAMLIMDRLGAGGSFTEFFAMDFDDDFLLMGHDGPGHLAISDAPPALRALEVFHGKRGGGLSVEFTVRPARHDPRPHPDGGRHLKLLAAEGESIPARPSASATRTRA